MNAGRVTRSCMVLGSWLSMQATGCSAYCRTSEYFRWFTAAKPLNMSPFSELVVNRDHGSVAVQACSERIGLLTLGEGLIVEHVGVAAAFAVVDREGIARPHGLQAGFLLELG